jgi:hypothetical protein
MTNLGGANLRGVDLSNCRSIANIYLSDAWLDKNKLRRQDLEGAIGEELAANYTQQPDEQRAIQYKAAKRGYLVLKQNFDDLGDYEAASWAYIREREMEKMEALFKTKDAFTKHKWKEGISCGFKVFLDELVKWLCNYGEGLGRVFFWIFVFIGIIGPACFWIFGAFQWLKSGNDVHFEYSLNTIDTFTTANFAEWQAASMPTRFISGFLAMLGIFLVGLLGFVAGNKIRRS